MKIGVLKEIKNHEYRVGITPHGAASLVNAGHEVFIENNAGFDVGMLNEDYKKHGAKIVACDDIYKLSELIVKVKEPQEVEYKKLKSNQILFTYLHLAPDPKQTAGLINSGCVAIAYETLTDEHASLPLLRPMSEIAGRMSIQAGAYALQKINGGSGTLLPGVAGVAPGKVLVLGAGTVGINAARVAAGMGAHVTITDISIRRLVEIDSLFGGKLTTIYANEQIITELIAESDLIIGAVLIPGAASPKLITRQHLNIMKKGSVIVDVAIDQGGSAESSKPTTHDNPTYIEKGIVHYCVTNMPGAVAKTSTLALTNATLPYISLIASNSIESLVKSHKGIRDGVNVYKGKVTNLPVAKTLNLPYYDLIN